MEDLLGIDALTDEGAAELKQIGHETTRRAGLTWMRWTGATEYSTKALPFVVGFGAGERDALRRAAIALSDPRSHGRERQVIAALAGGLDIEDAIRAAHRPEPEPDQSGSNVVSLRPSISR